MPYVNPRKVVAPRRHLSDLEVLYDGGPGGYALARLRWDGEGVVGIRWNGSENEPGMGQPQSSANPTWFILPPELGACAVEFAEQNDRELQDDYRAMAADREREAEAWDWTEGLITDGTGQEG